MPRDRRLYLDDILEAIGRMRRHVGGMSFGPVNRQPNGVRFIGFRVQIPKRISRPPERRAGLVDGWAMGTPNPRPAGARFTSPGQRPGNRALTNTPALKGRDSFRASVSAWRSPIGFGPFRAQPVFGVPIPRAVPCPGRRLGLTNYAPLGHNPSVLGASRQGIG